MNEVRTTLRDDLIAAKALIARPEDWCQGTAKYSDYGWVSGEHGVHMHYRRCAIGALRDACRGTYASAWSALRSATSPWWRFWRRADPQIFNDTHAHSDVMALFDRAIASAESST